MRYGSTGMMSKQSSSVRSGIINYLWSCRKHNRANQIWKSCLLFALTVEVWCIWVHSYRLDNKARILPDCGIYKKQSERNDRDLSRYTADFFSRTVLPCTWLFDFDSFLWQSKFQRWYSHTAALISLKWAFRFPKLKVSLKICGGVLVEEMQETFPEQLQHICSESYVDC